MTQPSRRARRSDPWDWASLHAHCLRSAQRVLGSQPAAEDAAQEASLKAWRHHAQCRTPECPEPWVAAIARREALRAIRPVVRPLSERAEPVDPGHERQAIRRVDVSRAVRTLTNDDRRLLLARYWADCTQEQAAALLGMPEGSAKVRLHRARARLRQALED
jgi:RNA polymerase sigma-70 factor, ECF subfamily